MENSILKARGKERSGHIRRLSSRATFFYKFVLPPFYTCVFAFGSLLGIIQWSRDGGPGGLLASMAFLILLLIIGLIFLWPFTHLKLLYLDGDELVVSNFFASERISTSHLAMVQQSHGQHPETITLHFAQNTRFGPVIAVMPTIRFSRGGDEHPTTYELRNLRYVHTGPDVMSNERSCD